MKTVIQLKILNDPKQKKYLEEHSYWYKDLNRNPKNYKEFLNAFKQYNRNVKINKVSETVDTLDTVNSILKILN